VIRPYYWKLTYFKASGKYYSSGVALWEIQDCDLALTNLAYYHDAIERVREMLRTGEPLPGLMGTWSHAILLEQCEPRPGMEADVNRTDNFVECGVPHLILGE
jgi:hypothetical protein